MSDCISITDYINKHSIVKDTDLDERVKIIINLLQKFLDNGKLNRYYEYNDLRVSNIYVKNKNEVLILFDSEYFRSLNIDEDRLFARNARYIWVIG